MSEKFIIKSIYGVDDDVTLCLKCKNTDLKTNVVDVGVSDIKNPMNWYCEKCKIVWVKGLKRPRF